MAEWLRDLPVDRAMKGLATVRTAQRCAGVEPWDEPGVADGRLHFRTRFQRGLDENWARWAEDGDWAGYVLAPIEHGGFDVLHTRVPERSAQRVEAWRASFARLEDAVAFVMVSVFDSARSALALDTVFSEFTRLGTDSRLVHGPPEDVDVARALSRLSPDRAHLVRHLTRISHRDDPSRHGVGFSGVLPYLNVLALSADDVVTALLSGVPRDVAECVADAG